MNSKKMNSPATWEELLQDIEELENSLDDSHYLSLEDWNKLWNKLMKSKK